jgi:hypothetical protein
LVNNRVKFDLYRGTYTFIGKVIIAIKREEIREIFRKELCRKNFEEIIIFNLGILGGNIKFDLNKRKS